MVANYFLSYYKKGAEYEPLNSYSELICWKYKQNINIPNLLLFNKRQYNIVGLFESIF